MEIFLQIIAVLGIVLGLLLVGRRISAYLERHGL